MDDLLVLDDPAIAAAALDATRSRILANLATGPGSAATVANELDLPRQKVRYHLKTLEERGLVVEVEQRRHGGITERIFSPAAAAYVVSPAAMGQAAAEPERIADQLSASYLVAVAARAVSEVGSLLRGARRADKRLATLTIDTEIRFADAAAQRAFAADLSAAVTRLAARHHDESARSGRTYRLIALSHVKPKETT